MPALGVDVDAQRQRRSGRLGQRRRQRRCQSAQIAGDGDLRRAAGQRDGRGHAGAAAQRTQPWRRALQPRRRTQRRSADRRADQQPQRVLGRHAAGNVQGAAEEVARVGVKREAALVEADAATNAAQRWQPTRVVDRVVEQLHAALHAALRQMIERQLQSQAAAERAAALHVAERVVEHGVERTVAQIAQRIAGVDAELAIGGECRVRVVGQRQRDALQAGAVHARAGVAHAHAAAAELEHTGDRAELRPQGVVVHVGDAGLAAVRQHRSRRRVEHAAADACGDLEAAASRSGERKLGQIAVHAGAYVARLARGDRAAQVVARGRRDRQRQIARHRAGVGAAQPRVEVDAARVPRLPGVAHAGAAGSVGVGELQPCRLQVPAAAQVAPVQLRVETLQRYRGRLEYGRQRQAAVAHRQLRAAAGLVGLHAAVQTVDSGQPRGQAGRGPAQATERNLCAVTPRPRGRRRSRRLVPVGGQAGQSPAQLQRLQALTPGERQRQPAQQCIERAEVDTADADAAAFAAAGDALLAVGGVERRQLDAVAAAQRQVLHRQRPAAGQPTQLHAPGKPREQQGRQRGGDAGLHAAQRDVGAELGQGVVRRQVGPSLQRAVAVEQFVWQRQLVRQLAEVGLRQPRPQPAVPAGEIGVVAREQWLMEVGAQFDRSTQAGRRRRAQRQPVAQQTVAQVEIDVVEHQRRGAAHLVGPAHAAVQDQDLALREQPVGEALRGAAARGAEVEAYAADLQVGRVGARDGQLHAAERELVEGQLHARQALPRRLCLDRSESQCRTTLRIVDHQIVQRQRRQQPAPARLHAADVHRQAERGTGRALQPRHEMLCIGQHRVAQRCQTDRQQQVDRDDQRDRGLEQPGGQFDGEVQGRHRGVKRAGYLRW